MSPQRPTRGSRPEHPLDKRTTIVAVIAAALGAAVGAGITLVARTPSVLDSESEGPTLARYAGNKLRLSDAEAQFRLPNPPSPSIFSTPSGRKEFVEGLVRIDLLARLAEEKGYTRDPIFLTRLKQELAAMYLEKEFEEPARKKDPTDVVIAKYFEENRSKLARPERLRLAVIAFRAEDDATRRTKRPVAQSVLAEVRRRANDYYAFGQIAAARSEEPKSASTSGELPAMSRGELEVGFGPTLAAQAFAMPRKAGTLLEGIVEGERGLFIVKLLGADPAYDPKLEDVRDAIRTQLVTEGRTKGLEAFLSEIWKKADVRIDEAALAQLKPAAPARAGAK